MSQDLMNRTLISQDLVGWNLMSRDLLVTDRDHGSRTYESGPDGSDPYQ
jgi:hypothetical protein